MKSVVVTLLLVAVSFGVYAETWTPDHVKEDIRHDIVAEIQKEYPVLTQDNIEVEVLNTDTFAYRLSNADSFKVSVIKGKNVLGRRIARVSLYDENQSFLNYFSVFFNVTASSDVFVFLNKIAKGKVISKQDVSLKTVPVKNSRFNYAILDLDNIIGRKTAYSVQSGDIVSKWTLSKDSFLEKGKSVDAVYKKGGIEVGVKAVTIENGELGDKIQVRVKPNGKVVLAEVKGSNYVEIMSDM